MAKTSRWSITVLGGPLRGTRFDAPPGTEEVLLGAEPGCDLFLDLPGVSPIHARIVFVGAGFVIRDAGSGRGVFVNDRRVDGEGPLQDEDLVWLGPPGEEESVLLKVRLPRDVGDLPPTDREKAPAPSPLFAAEPAGGPDQDLELPPLAPAPDVFVEPEPPNGVGEAWPADDAVEPPQAAVPGAQEELDLVPPQPPGGDDDFDIASWASREPKRAEAGGDSATEAGRSLGRPPVADAASGKPAASLAGALASPAPARAAAPTTAEAGTRAAARPAAATTTPALSAADAWLAGLDEVPRPAPSTQKAAVRRSDPSGRPARRRSVLRSALPVLAGVAALGVAAGGFFAWRSLGTPRVVAISPERAQPGDTVVLTGSRISADPAAVQVRFGTQVVPARSATAERVEVVVPDLATQPGRDVTVGVVLVSRGRAATALSLSVYRPPELKRLDPDYGLGGDEITLFGTGWGEAPQVRFGAAEAVVLETAADRLRVRVPELQAAAGEQLAVSVWAGANSSKPAAFLAGRPPLLVGVEPAAARPGAELALTGRGFAAAAARNAVRVGGARALVVAASAEALRIVVPHLPAGAPQQLEIRVEDQEPLTRAIALESAPPLALVAQPFGSEAPEARAALATAFGPLIVLNATSDRAAAARALAVQRAWQRGGTPEARGLEGDRPTLVLAGAGEGLLEVAPEDVRGYSEAARRGDPPLTAARLALWWEALLRDLRQLEAGQPAAAAAGLAPEGRLLGELGGAPSPDLARRLEALASRLPAAVPAARAAGVAPGTTAAPVAAAGAPAAGGGAEPAAPAGAFVLEGVWKGREDERGAVKFVTVIFDGKSGRLVYGSRAQVSTPFRQFDRRGEAEIHFAIEHGRGGLRHYRGRWDGQKIAGTISDAAGKPIGTFVIQR